MYLVPDEALPGCPNCFKYERKCNYYSLNCLFDLPCHLLEYTQFNLFSVILSYMSSRSKIPSSVVLSRLCVYTEFFNSNTPVSVFSSLSPHHPTHSNYVLVSCHFGGMFVFSPIFHGVILEYFFKIVFQEFYHVVFIFRSALYFLQGACKGNRVSPLSLLQALFIPRPLP